MGFNCGIVGLPNVGKSTLFNALTAGSAPASNYPFCTIDPNIGIVPVADPRLDPLARIFQPEKIVPTTIEFVDIAGLVKGASKGEGLGNQFLSHIREVDAIAHVVRCFDDPNVVHVDGSVNPRRDIEVLDLELLLKDLETVEHRHDDVHRKAKSGDKKLHVEVEFYDRVRAHLSQGRPARTMAVHGSEESGWLRSLHFLTDKPVLYVCNVGESNLARESEHVAEVRRIAAQEGAPVVTVSAELEAEVARLSPEDRPGFLADLGLLESGLQKVVHEGYALLHLITFFTGGAREVHAWTVKNGTTAPQAAGVVHSDFEKGFVRAEVMNAAELIRMGSEQALRDHGLVRTEGRDYVVCDGDVLYIRFTT
jgi:ribosome-binding ATPase